jgi:hypothetical protein
MNGRMRAANMDKDAGDTRHGKWCCDCLRGAADGGGVVDVVDVLEVVVVEGAPLVVAGKLEVFAGIF